jgi:hypothetical protein
MQLLKQSEFKYFKLMKNIKNKKRLKKLSSVTYNFIKNNNIKLL